MSSRSYHTGILSVADPQRGGRIVGMVDGSSDAQGAGSVRFSLDLRAVPPIEFEGPFVYVTLAEQAADELARRIGEVVLRSRHLRALDRLGLLRDAPPAGELCPSTSSPSRGDVPLHWVAYRSGVAVISFGHGDAHVRVRFEGAAAVRVDPVQTEDGAPTASFGLIEAVETSDRPAPDAQAGEDAEEFPLRHYRVWLGAERVEVVARAYRVERNTTSFAMDDDTFAAR